MQNNSNYIDYAKLKFENDKRKKDELLNSNLFKILEADNKAECDRLVKFLKDKSFEEIDNILKYIINQKSIQKTNF